jgi:carbamoyltransferase
MFSSAEDQVFRDPKSNIDRNIRATMLFGFGKYPETRVFEETIDPWLQWLLRDIGLQAADIDLVVTSDCHFATCWVRLGRQLKQWFPHARVVRSIEHHQIHQRQAFWQSGFEEAAVITLDTCGEHLLRHGGRKLAGTISAMSILDKQKVYSEFFFPESSIGLIYDVVSGHVGFRQGDEGKTMGLAPWGEPELFEELRPALRLRADGSFTFMDHQEFIRVLERYVPAREPGEELTQRHENVAYAGQMIVNLVVANAFEAALRMTGLPDIAYAGGVALNSVANEFAYRETKPRRLYVATNPGDPGHALGCALYGAYELAGWPAPRQELREYLGPTYTVQEIEQVVANAGFSVARPDEIEAVMARCIANGYIAARFAERAEFGPRALGNRSIICDPRRPDMKDYLNAHVKHREGFRPFAPTVLEEHAADWFDLDARSSYMLRVVPVRPEVRDRIPAIVHVDGTARVQTLAYDENPGYWRLINAFHTLTGVPVVLNTSFNIGGKPIVETPQDAVECFASTNIDVLNLEPFVLSKLPLDTYVQRSRDG